MSEDQIIRDTIRAFREKEVEALWERIDRPERERYEQLWAGLSDVGVQLLGLPEAEGGLEVSAEALFEVFSELGAGSPALALGALLHVCGVALVREAVGGELQGELADAAAKERFALPGSPLERAPRTGFTLRSNGARLLGGEQRVAQPFADWLVIPAREGDAVKLAVVVADAEGLSFAPQPSLHGLKLLPFGTLRADAVQVEHVFELPDSGRVQQRADGLMAAVLAGMMREMAARASAYAIERYQGGKMIHEHDTIRLLIAPIQLAARAGRALAIDTLRDRTRAGDGGASAFLIEHARQAGLDSVQSFGGYGYMEDYRVERYLRDANTLETFFIHASATTRRIAATSFAELQR
ncbi:MAG: acyl-CoA/acyl-ACP dehydrogenase [Myxococcales bacterium]|nr:acyl-CoA/acyl-ACP dehydrogenase [Myxococcales bacterium]